jgi:2-enoate reductase
LQVIAVGSITPEMGEDILRQGKADFIALGRALLADPELPNKLAINAPEDIRPCTRCQEHERIGESVRCVINAETGFEGYTMMPPLKRKKVLVIGGGAAGMEAARVSALRGHDVTLYEKSSSLGGHLTAATVPSFKEDLRNYKDWLIRQIKKLDVKIELGREMTASMVEATKPEVLIVATGSTAYYPTIPGIDKPIVTTAIDLLLGRSDPGNKTIIVGGGFIGCEVALHLAQQGKQVAIAEMMPEIASDLTARGSGGRSLGGITKLLKIRLMDYGVDILVNSKVIGITDSGVTVIDHGREVVPVQGDKVALAVGLISKAELYRELKGKVRETYLIGDCVEPRRIGEATREAYLVGSTI